MTTLFPGSSKKEDILDWAFDGRMDKIREGINDGYDSDDIHSCIMVISKTCELDDLKFLIEKLIADTPERKLLDRRLSLFLISTRDKPDSFDYVAGQIEDKKCLGSALKSAVRQDREDLVDILIKHDVDTATEFHVAMRLAAERGSKKMIRKLLPVSDIDGVIKTLTKLRKGDAINAIQSVLQSDSLLEKHSVSATATRHRKKGI